MWLGFPLPLTKSPSAAVSQVSADQKKKWDPPVELLNLILTRDQTIRVKGMLRDECEAFKQSDDGIGCAVHLQMGLELMDKKPVHSSNMVIPKALYQKLKDYIVSLLQKPWMRKSTSRYASPIVCVRKMDPFGYVSIIVNLMPKQSRTSISFLECRMPLIHWEELNGSHSRTRVKHIIKGLLRRNDALGIF